MAQRRMFSIRVVTQPRFLRLPPSARLAYYDLCMAADDDGFVEGFNVLRLTGATEDDLKALEGIGYLRLLNADCLCWIVLWGESNKVPPDRYKPSIYHDALADLQAGNHVELNFLDGNSLSTACKQIDDSSIPQVRLGQFSSGESMSGQSQPDNDADNDESFDTYYRRMFPAMLKEFLSCWCGFGKITLAEIRDLLFDKGVEPEVIAWVAQKAADNSIDTQGGYFRKTISDKAISPDGQRCTTLDRLAQLEGLDTGERQRIRMIADQVRELKEQLQAEWASETEQPF